MCISKKTVAPFNVVDTNAMFEAKFESMIATYKNTELPMKRENERIFVGLEVKWDPLCVKI